MGACNMLGIRRKLVLLLVAVTLVPLVAALVVVGVGGIRLRRDSFRRAYEAVAVSAATAFKTHLVSDVRLLKMVLESPDIVETLETTEAPRPWAEIARIEESWPRLDDEEPVVRRVLDGPGAADLDRLKVASPRFVEIFFTDRHGQLVTSTNKTSDYYQGDEEWWTGALRGGQGGVMIPPIGYDASSGEWSLDLCLPIFDPRGMVVGVGKGVVRLNAWFEELRMLASGIGASVILVDRSRWIVYREEEEPQRAAASEWALQAADAERPGWRITADGTMQAYIPLAIAASDVGGPIRMPLLSVVVYGEESEAAGALYRLAALAFAIGLVGIGVMFFGVLYMIDRSIVRRILHIAEAARQVAGGDLTVRSRSRTDGQGELQSDITWSDDEIDTLGRDFDSMVERVETSYRQLAAANDLKRRFIGVAGHELRTPISYIAGKAKLLHGSPDLGRLQEALRSIATKAERLHRIVESMFKLMPDGILPRTVSYEEIETAAFLQELTDAVNPFLQSRSQTLEVDASSLPRFRADREKLLDVLENLLTNAIKFTPDGGTIRLEARSELGGQVAFAVIDQGEGIPDDEIYHLFEPFFSGGDLLRHSTGQSEYGKRGIGLGLAVVRYFVQLHGGTVEAKSGPGGSTFTVRIPTRPPEGLERPSPSHPPSSRGAPPDQPEESPSEPWSPSI
jgi:signal transduction histidine kinase